MASEIRVNKINSRTGFGTITVSETGQDLVGITTIENLTTENTLVGAAASFTGNVQVGGVLTYEDVTNIDSVGLITARQGIEVGARPGVAASISVDGNMIVSGISTFGGDINTSGGNVSIAAATDIRFTNSSDTWSGSVPKIQHYGNKLYILGGSDGIRFREGPTDRWDINGDGHFVPRNDSQLDIGTDALRVANGYFDSLITNNGGGNAALGSHLDLGDNQKARFGAGDDLQLYHNGSDSFIDENGTGDLKIRTVNGNGIQLISGSSANMITCATDGAVKLYYNSLQRLETTSSGVTISRSGDPILTVTGSGHAQLNLTSTSGSDHCGVNFGDSDDVNAGMIQYTNSNNAMQFHTNGSERYRIHSNGIQSWNNTTFPYNEHFHFYAGITGKAGMSLYFATDTDEPGFIMRHGRSGANSGAYTGKLFQFRNSSGNENGSIASNASVTAYNTSSDYRLKENEVTISDAISKVKQLKPYTFNFKVTPDQKVDGFFAHEAQEVIPYAVLGEKDAENMQQMDYGKLTPLLTAALKEAIAEIETLKAEVSALKG